jgi:sugar/nucleoside kinase (ribokinase family)
MHKTRFDLIVAGEINPDLILTGNVQPQFGQVEKLVDSAQLTIGSSAVIFACGAARLGLRVTFVGVCGDDVFGRFMLNEMQQRNIDTSGVIIDSRGKTGLSVILARGSDRAILTHLGLMSALKPSDIPITLVQQARHFHIGSYFLQTQLQTGLPALFRDARKLGLTTSLDTNYDPSEEWVGFDELLSFTNVFFPNEREALSLSGEKNRDLAVKRLSTKVETLALKLGPDGALGARDDQMIQVPSLPVKVADTVGAGDSFDAGFIYGYLNNWNLKNSLKLGCACGSLSTREHGGTDGQPDLDEAMQRLQT